MSGRAVEMIPCGASVLCVGFTVRLADPSIANGTAAKRPPIGGQPDKHYAPGEIVGVEPIQGLGARDLKAIANGPLMDANNIFLPAGRLTMAEYRARVAADLTRLSDEA